jgi:hypothetical protein
MSEETSPDRLLTSSLQRHSSDSVRLQPEITHLAEALNAAQAELERRPPTQPTRKANPVREKPQRSVTGLISSSS